MVGLEKYNDTTKEFLKAIAETNRELRVSDRTLYIYDGGAWSVVSPSQKDELDRILRDASDEHSFPFAEKYSQLWRHVTSSLALMPYDEVDKLGYIALNNGTLDPSTGELHDHDPDHMTTRRASVKYVVGAKCPTWLRMLDAMLDGKSDKDKQQYKTYIQMFFGLALAGYRNYSGRSFRKLLVLYGPERTGKTTIAEVLRHLIGDRDIATENVDELCTRFGLANVVRARAIISDDAVGLKSKVEAKILKKLITGEPMTADRKMQTAVSFRFNGPILITTNVLPEVRDATHALYGRTTVLTLERQFSKQDAARDLEGMQRVTDLLEKKKEFPGILNWALQGLSMVVDNDGLPEVAEANEAAGAWRAENDPVYAFLTEHCEYDASTINYQTPLAGAISVFAEVQLADKSYSPRRVKTLLGREVRNVIPGVTCKKQQFMKVPTNCMIGLRLRESGEAYVGMAKEKGLIGSEKWPLNQKAL